MHGYTDTIRNYALDNTRVGRIENADGTGEVGLSGDQIGKKLAVRFTLTRSVDSVDIIRYQVFGCGFTIAACAAAAELAEGLPLAEASMIDAWIIKQKLKGLPDERSYCAELAASALQAAVHSAEQYNTPVHIVQHPDAEEHAPRLSPADPLYRTLINSPYSGPVAEEDRSMFAALLTLAAQEPYALAEGLGLEAEELTDLLGQLFPEFDQHLLNPSEPSVLQQPPPHNPDVLHLLLFHLPPEPPGDYPPIAAWLARILAARAAQSGHLWIAMGFFKRPQLTAAIRRHLPSLAAANSKGMRWKRYLFKQVCDMNGGNMCKAPNCGACSDYALCFAPD